MMMKMGTCAGLWQMSRQIVKLTDHTWCWFTNNPHKPIHLIVCTMYKWWVWLQEEQSLGGPRLVAAILVAVLLYWSRIGCIERMLACRGCIEGMPGLRSGLYWGVLGQTSHIRWSLCVPDWCRTGHRLYINTIHTKIRVRNWKNFQLKNLKSSESSLIFG